MGSETLQLYHFPFSWETNGNSRLLATPRGSVRPFLDLPQEAERVPLSSLLCSEVVSPCCWYLFTRMRSVLSPRAQWVNKRAVARIGRAPESPSQPILGREACRSTETRCEVPLWLPAPVPGGKMPALQLSAMGTQDSLPQERVNLSAPRGCSSNSDWKCRALYETPFPTLRLWEP